MSLILPKQSWWWAFVIVAGSIAIRLCACSSQAPSNTTTTVATHPSNHTSVTNKPMLTNHQPSNTPPTNGATETITLGAGCFWCVEAVFQQLRGVIKAESGYAGGNISKPTYREVCSGRTGHAEVVQITFDPTVISLDQILTVFWNSHNPTTLNQQGADLGTQYRSAIFYHNEQQKAVATASLKNFETNNPYQKPVVTEITAFTNFYPAEDYHQDYFAINGHEPYCQAVIAPKVSKVQKQFQPLLK